MNAKSDRESHRATWEYAVTTHVEQIEALQAAERLGVQTLCELAVDCRYVKILTGNTKRGPAFVYACEHCADVSVISVPAGGLRDRDPGDPTSRTRLATYSWRSILLETGAFIESDGTVRGRLVIHMPGRSEPEWEITSDGAGPIGEALHILREFTAR
jgi:hypothetical protein